MDLQPYLELFNGSDGSDAMSSHRAKLLTMLTRLYSATRSASTDNTENLALADGPTFSPEERPGRIATLRKHTCACQCRRFLGMHRDSAGNVDMGIVAAEVVAIMEEYRYTLDLNSGAEGGQREVQHGDELLMMAVHMLRDLSSALEAQGDSVQSFRRHIDALLLLEYGRFVR